MNIHGVKPYVVNGAKTLSAICPVCQSQENLFLVGAVVGPNLGFFWLPNKYHLGYRKYWLKCPRCSNIVKEMTHAEVIVLKSDIEQ
jgi:hypothetical protein